MREEKVIDRLNENTFPKKNIAMSAALNIIRQACMIAFPLITYSYATRILGTAAIGVYEFTLSVISYFALLAALGINQYAVRDGAEYLKNSDGKLLDDFVSEVFSINMITTAVSYLILVLSICISPLLGQYKKAILIYSISIVFTTVGVDWINSLLEDYLYLTLRYIAIQCAAVVLLIIFVKTPDDLYKYIVISIVGPVAAGILNFIYVRRHVRLRFTLKCNFKRHWKPIFILFCNNIASVVYLNSDVTILRVLSDENAVGLYGVATKIYSMIKSLMNAAIFVTIPRFSMYVAQQSDSNQGKSANEMYMAGLKNLLTPLFAVILPASIGLMLLSDDVIRIISGNDFVAGAMALSILGVALFFAVFACFLGYSVVMPYKMEKYFLASTTVAAIVNIILNFILIPVIGLNAAAWTTLLAEIMVCTFLFIISMKKVNILSIMEKRDLLAVIVGSLVVGAGCLIVKRIPCVNSSDGIIHVLIILASVAIIMVIYALLLALMRHSVIDTIRNIVGNKLKRG